MPKFMNSYNLLSYDDMFAQAVFAKDQAEVEKIVENFRAQLKFIGIEAYEALVEAKYQENPKSVFVY